MRFKHWKTASFFAISIASQIDARFDRLADRSNDRTINSAPNKDQFIDSLISKMSVSDLDQTMHLSPKSPIGVMHDWYPMNKSYFNAVQKLQLEKSHVQIPLMLVEECLHGVGSFKQSLFPQNIAMAASFDTDIVYRVGRAIGTEARSIGIHGCFSPVLDLAQEPRWGRVQETFGEDKVLTSHIGVAYSSGLSKNKTWSEDAVFPIMKHFAAHGAAQAGHNTAPFTGLGTRQIMQDLFIPFKANFDKGGARGVMMAYHEIDGIPAAVSPMLYQALEDWGFDGFTLADDTCMRNLLTEHKVASSQADAMQQWFNAGGMIDFYDWDLDSYLTTTKDLVANGSVPLKTLQSHVRQILGVKWDLGLFNNPYIPDNIDPLAIVASHQDVALEAAHKSIILLKNDNSTLPLDPSKSKVALIGPFADTINLGDYSGALGQYPAKYAHTLRQGMLSHLKNSSSGGQLKSSWGTNSWEYNNQYVVPGYLLSAPDGTAGGLKATYYAETNFTSPKASRLEVPAQDWGLYPPQGLSSNNFSAIWEGQFESPTDLDVNGWIGVAIGPNSTSKLYVDGKFIASKGYGPDGNVLGNIEGYGWIQQNNSIPPQDGVEFTFKKGAKHNVKIELQSWNNFKKTANVNSVNSQLIFWWNLVSPNGDALDQAVAIAQDSDVIVLAVGAAWNSDGEGGDRGTLDLAPSQEALARKIYALGKPVVLVLEGGRPFAIPDHYQQSAAVLDTHFGGQAGGQAIADVIFGAFNPGGRVPITIPYSVGQLPAYYNYKPSARAAQYLDIPSDPVYPFGHGLSYTTFSTSSPTASIRSTNSKRSSVDTRTNSQTFGGGDWIDFSVTVQNTGTVSGSYVVQIYLLGRVSIITQPVKQLVAFQRVYLDAGEKKTISLELEVDRYLMILDRTNKWELEKGSYTFSLLENGGSNADTSKSVSLQCVG
ncbi:glycoside hydrolase family 3 protein [Trichoderma asperellum CBS 433.97]|uniref:xylan 1,4-beta-xylosidase n=2 Tax=Trichoderma asperellum TaxID=101201 RepID=A0A2T3ZGG2_TRIA4|nr:glycoside hydrolase family 3 protein [Trichoderma asperellum CBS 433.97]PTB43898.1 glycoside hydrolase family 3 protein [Trichoderma asperellum CBS 433.97]